MSATEFSVFWWDELGLSYRDASFVDADTAVHAAKAITDRLAAREGRVQRVIITDGGDCTVFEWKHGAGVTWPPQSSREEIAQ
jgi:hypothetical protein